MLDPAAFMWSVGGSLVAFVMFLFGFKIGRATERKWWRENTEAPRRMFPGYIPRR